MQNITTALELKESIRLLEVTQVAEGRICKEQFYVVLESIKPVNLIKNTFNEVVSSPNLMNSVLGTTIGLAAGYLSNKTVVGSSENLLQKLLGTLLQFGVTTLIIKNSESIKSFI